MTKKIIKYFIIVALLGIAITIFFNAKEYNNISEAASRGNVSDVQLLARAINGEARGEPYEGQVAVGAVILNDSHSIATGYNGAPI